MKFSPSFVRRVARLLIVVYTLAISSPAWANPEGATVVGGAATVTDSPGLTHVRQSTDRAIINWNSFSNAAGETVRFSQPTATSATLNRVTGANSSVINGALQANGNVYLVNPNGVLFGKTATVNVNGLVASSLDIRDEHFMSGRNDFKAVADKPAAAVVNQGRITTQKGGHVALVGGLVNNEGTITSPGGRVILAAGSEVTLALDGAGLVSVGKVTAPRDVRADSEAVSELVEQAVNTTGVASAAKVTRTNGHVFLGQAEGMAINEGTIDVNAAEGSHAGKVRVDSAAMSLLGSKSLITANGVGPESNGGVVRVMGERSTVMPSGARIEAKGGATGDGGFVEVSGKTRVYVDGSVSTRAQSGKAGTFLIDPASITIVNGSAPQGVDNTQLALSGGATNGSADDDATINAADGCGTFTISEQRLEQLAQDGNSIVLEATTNITLQTLTDGVLNLSGAPTVTFRATNGGGSITTNALILVNGAGGFVAENQSGSINFGCAVVATGSGGITVDAAGTVFAGCFQTNNATIDIEAGKTLSSSQLFLAGTISAGTGDIIFKNDAQANSEIRFCGQIVTGKNVTASVNASGGAFQDNGAFTDIAALGTVTFNGPAASANAIDVNAPSVGGTARSAGTDANVTIGSPNSRLHVLIPSTGSILDGNGASNNLFGASFSLQAASCVGGSGDPIESSITSSLDASARQGGVFVRANGAITLGTVTAGCAVDIRTMSAGNITLGTGVGAGLVSGSTIHLETVDGSILDGNGATFTNVSLAGNSVTLIAGGAGNVGAIEVAAASGGTFSAGGGTNALVLTTDATIGALSGARSVTVFAEGAILDGNDGVTPGTANIDSPIVTLKANGAIGADTSCASVIAGEIELSNSFSSSGTDLIAQSGLAAGNQVGASIHINHAANSLRLCNVAADDNGARDSISLRTTGSFVDGNGGGFLCLRAGTINLVAAGAIGACGGGGELDISASLINASSGSGGIFLISQGSIALGLLSAQAGAADVIFTASGGISDGNDGTPGTLNVFANHFGAAAGTNLGATGVADMIETNASTFAASSGNSGDGGVFINELDGAGNGLGITFLNTRADGTGAGGDAQFLLGTATTLSVNACVVSGGGSFVSTGTGGGGGTAFALASCRSISTSGGNVTLNQTGQIQLNGTVSGASSGDITLQSGGAISMGGLSSITGRDVVMTATGNILLDDINAGCARTIDVRGNNVTLNDEILAAGGASTVNILAAGGISATNGGGCDILGGTLNLAAGTSVGTCAAINVVAGTLNAVAASGNVSIVASNNIDLGTVTASGNVNIQTSTAGQIRLGSGGSQGLVSGANVTLVTANGSIVDQSVGVTNVAVQTGGNVTLTSNGGTVCSGISVARNGGTATFSNSVVETLDVTLGTLNMPFGTVTIYAPGSILDGNGATANVRADRVVLTAATAVGSCANAIDLQASGSCIVLDASAGSNSVFVDSASELGVGTVTASSGSVRLTSLSNIVDLSGDGPGADITANSVTLSSSGAAATIGQTGNRLDVDAGTLVVSALGLNTNVHLNDISTGGTKALSSMTVDMNQDNGVRLQILRDCGPTLLSAGGETITANACGIVVDYQNTRASTPLTVNGFVSNNYRIRNDGDITIASATLGSGDATFQSLNGSVTLSSGTNLDINGRGTGHDLSFFAKNDITINSQIFDSSPGGDSFSVSLTRNLCGADVTGSILINSSIFTGGSNLIARAGQSVTNNAALNAVSGEIQLDAETGVTINGALNGHVSLSNNGSGTITQTAPMTGGVLRVNGNTPATLTNAGNNMGLITAIRSASLTYSNGGSALTVGDGTTGVFTSSGDISLTAGSITIAAIAAGAGVEATNGNVALTTTAGNLTGNASLDVKGLNLDVVTAGSILSNLDTQISAAGTISARVNGSGPGLLNDVNVASMKLRVGNTSQNYTIGRNGGPRLVLCGGMLSTTGGSLPTDTAFEADAGTLLVSGIAMSGKDLSLTVADDITQGGSNLVVADLLVRSLVEGKSITLNNATNAVTTLAADVKGALTLVSAVPLTVGSATAATEVTPVNGLTTTNDSVSLKASSVSISQAISVGTGSLTLEGTDPCAQTVQSVAIAANGLILNGAGEFVLTNASNDVASLSGTGTGAVTFVDANGLALGALNAGSSAVSITAGGSITDGNDAPGTLNVTAGGLTLAAGCAIGATGSAGEIEISANSLTATASNGGVFIREANGITLTSITASGASHDVEIFTTAGGITVGAITATQNVVLSAAGALSDDGNDATVVVAPNVSVTGTTIGSAAANADLDVNTDFLTVTGNGAVVIREVAAGGGLTLSALTTAGAGDATINVAGGALSIAGAVQAAGRTVTLAANGTISGAGLITATTVDLDAAGALTAHTSASSVDADTSAAGGIAVDNAGTAVTFTSVSSSNGAVTLSSDAQLSIGSSVAAGGANNVSLSTSAGNIVLTGSVNALGDTATINSAGAISGAGTVTAATVDLDAAGSITANTAATTVDADTSAAGAIAVANTGSAVTFTTVSSSNGAVTLSNNAQLTIGTSATAGGTANLNLSTIGANNIVLSGIVNAAGDTATVNSGGAISGAGSITAATVDLDAAGAISANTVASSVDADSTGTGNITVANTGGAVQFVSVSTNSGDITLSNDGTLTIATSATALGSGNFNATTTSGGNITVNGTVCTAGHVAICAAGSISVLAGIGSGAQTTLTSGGGNIAICGNIIATGQLVVNSAGAISGGNTLRANCIDLDAAGSITVDVNAIFVDADTSAAGAISITKTGTPIVFTSVSSFDGAVSLSNSGALTVLTSVTAGGANNISISSGGNNVQLCGAVNAPGDTVAISAGGTMSGPGAITGSSVDLDASGAITANTIASTVDADVSGTGGIIIHNTGGAVVFTSVSTANGSVELESDAQMTIGTSVTAGGAFCLSLLTSSSGIVLNGNVCAAGDFITITSAGALSGAGTITSSSLDINAATCITANTAVSVADVDTSGAGAVSVANSGSAVTFTSVSSTNGAVTLSNDAQLTIGTSVTAGGTGNLTLSTSAGNIVLTGGVNAAGDTVTIASGGTISGAGTITASSADLDAAGSITASTIAATVDADASATGAVTISNTGGAVTFTSVSSSDGAVVLSNAGQLTIGTSVTAGGANNLSLTATGANVVLTGNVNAAGDTATITAGGSITGAGTITAASVDLDAAGAITANTAANSVDADASAAGAVTLANAGSAVTFTSVSSSNGAVTLSNDAQLTIGSSVTAGGANNLNLSTSAGNVVLTGTVDATGDTATIASAGSISGAGTITASTVDLDAAGSIAANTVAATVDADASAAGAVTVANTGGAVTFTSVASSNGAVALSNNAQLTIGTSVTAGGANNLSLTTSAGNVVLTGGVGATGGTATIASAGTISGAGTITAATVDFDAAGSIAANTAATTVDADTSAAGAVTIANTGGAVTFTSVSSSDGVVTLSNAGQLTIGTSVTAGGANNLSLTATGANVVLSGNVDATGDTATINSGGSISGAGTITASTVDLDAAGAISANTAASSVDADTTAAGAITVANAGTAVTFLSVASSNGAVALSNNAQLTIGTSVTAGGANNLSLTTSAGNVVLTGGVGATGGTATIASAGTISGAGTITASTVDLDAAGSIAANTAAATIDADTSAAGAVTIANTGGAVTFTSVSSSDGVVTLSNAGQLTIGTSVTAGGANNLSLTATGANVVLTGNVDATGDTATINAGGSISGAGTITASTVDLDAAGAISANSAASSVDADTTAAGAITVANAGTAVTFTSVASSNGAVTLSNDAQLTIGTSVTAGGANNLSLTTSAGNVVLTGNVDATGDTATIASAGSISGAGAITASTVDLDAAGSIAANTVAATVDADTSAAGAVTIANTGGAVTFTSVSSSNGAVTLSNAGQLTIGTSVTAGGANNLSLTATGANVVLTGNVDATGDTATINAGGSISGAGSITASTVDLDAAGAISANTVASSVDADTTAAGAITVANSGAAVTFTSVTSSNGAVTLSNNAQLTIGSSVTAGGTANLSLSTSAGNIVLAGAVNAAGGTATVASAGTISGAGAITANTADLDAAGSITASTIAAVVDADASAAGAVTIANTGGAVMFTSVSTSNGVVTLSNAGQLTIGTSVTAGGASNLNLSTGAGNIVLSGGVDATGDTVAINSAGSISGAGAITAGTVDLDAVGSIAANTVAATVDADASGAGAVTIANTGGAVTFTSVSSTDGAVTLSNAGQLTIGSSVTAGGASNLSLSATGGNVVLTGNVDATGDTATINSGGSIAGAGTIAASTVDLDAAGAITANTAASLVDADTTAAGAITVANSGGAVTFASVSSSNGAVTLTNNAQLTIGTSVTAGGAGNLSLSTSAGDIDLAGNVDAAGDTVTINSAGIISGAGTITAGTVDLDAAGSIAARTIAGSVDADSSAAGTILLSNTGGAAVQFTSVSSAAGDVRLEADGAVVVGNTVAGNGGSLTVRGSTAAPMTLLGNLTASFVTLSSPGPIQDGNGASTNITAPRLVVSAANGFGGIGDPIDTNADDISITVSGSGAIAFDNSAHVGRLSRLVMSTSSAANAVSAVVNSSGDTVTLSGGVLSGDFGDTACASLVVSTGDLTLGALAVSDAPAAGTGILPAALSDSLLLQVSAGALRDDGDEATVISAPRLQLIATGGIGGTGTGALDIQAGTVFASSTLTPGALNVPIFLRSLAADSVITSFGSVVNVTSTGNLVLSQVTASSSIALNVTGSILDLATNVGPSLSMVGGIGASVNLVAGGTIGTAINPLNIQVANSNVVVNAAGVDASNTSVVLAGNLGGGELKFADFPSGLALFNSADVTPIRPITIASIVAEVFATTTVRVADPAVSTNTAASLPPAVAGASAVRVFALSSSGPTVEAPVINSSTGAAVPAGGSAGKSSGSKSESSSSSKGESASTSKGGKSEKSEKSESSSSKKETGSDSKEDSSSGASGRKGDEKKSENSDKKDEKSRESSDSDGGDEAGGDSSDRKDGESDGDGKTADSESTDEKSDGGNGKAEGRRDQKREGKAEGRDARGKSGKMRKDRDGEKGEGKGHRKDTRDGKLRPTPKVYAGTVSSGDPQNPAPVAQGEAQPPAATNQPGGDVTPVKLAASEPVAAPDNSGAAEQPVPSTAQQVQPAAERTEATPVNVAASEPKTAPESAGAAEQPVPALAEQAQPAAPQTEKGAEVLAQSPSRADVPSGERGPDAAAAQTPAGEKVAKGEPVADKSTGMADAVAETASTAADQEPSSRSADGKDAPGLLKSAERKLERSSERAAGKRPASVREDSENRVENRVAELAPKAARTKSADEIQLERDEAAEGVPVRSALPGNARSNDMGGGLVAMSSTASEMASGSSTDDASAKRKAQRAMSAATAQPKAADLKPMMSSSAASALGGRTGALSRPTTSGFGSGRTGSFTGSFPSSGRVGSLR